MAQRCDNLKQALKACCLKAGNLHCQLIIVFYTVKKKEPKKTERTSASQSFWYVNLRECVSMPSHTPPVGASEGSSVALVGLVKERLQLLLGGGLLLLHQVSVAFGDTPAVRCGHGGAQGTTGRRLQLLPVVTTSPERRRISSSKN